MAEAVPEKPLPLAEVRLPDARSLPLKFCLPGQRLFTSSEVEDEELKQYSLQGIEKIDRVEISIEQTPEKENAANASSGEVIAENADETLASKAITENTGETTDAAPAVEEVSAVEATNDQTTEEQDTEVQEVEEPEIKIETAPADFRFPTTNQTRHCFTRYIEYHRCVAAKGEDAPECNKFAKYYRSLCPSEWVERWNEQRQNGTFPGPL